MVLRDGGGIGGGMGSPGAGLRSQHSFGAGSADPGAGNKSLNGGSIRNAPLSGGTGSIGPADGGANSPLMGSAGGAPLSAGATSSGKPDSQQGDAFVQRAKALYACKHSHLNVIMRSEQHSSFFNLVDRYCIPRRLQ
jgi:SHO1 osmosensor